MQNLFTWRAQIDEEIRTRGLARTGTSLSGEVAEKAVAIAYQGTLAPQAAKGADVICADGTRIQVKTRAVITGKRAPFWEFKNFDFDLAVVVSMDPQTMTIRFAREYSRDELRAQVTEHPSGSLRLPTARGRDHGRDITDRLQEALETLTH